MRADLRRRRSVPRRLDRGGPGPEARVRVAAIAGLAKLSRDDEAEKILRAAWTNPKEAYGARSQRLARAWSAGKSRTPTSCSRAALKSPPITMRSPPRRSSSCWKLPERNPASWPRFIASMVSRTRCDPRPSGPSRAWPKTIRRFRTSWSSWPTTTIAPCGFRPGTRCASQGQEGPAGARGPARSRKRRLRRHTRARSQRGHRGTQETNGRTRKSASRPTAEQAKTIADLERQAADLEKKTKELRSRIAALKHIAGAGGASLPRRRPATAPGHRTRRRDRQAQLTGGSRSLTSRRVVECAWRRSCARRRATSRPPLAARARLRPERRSAGRPSRSRRTTSSAFNADATGSIRRRRGANGWRSRARRPGGHSGDLGEDLDHLGDARFPDAPLRGVIELDESFDRRQHADDLFLADLHAPADAHMRADRVPPAAIRSARPTQQARALRPANRLSARERHQVKSLMDILRQTARPAAHPRPRR